MPGRSKGAWVAWKNWWRGEGARGGGELESGICHLGEFQRRRVGGYLKLSGVPRTKQELYGSRVTDAVGPKHAWPDLTVLEAADVRTLRLHTLTHIHAQSSLSVRFIAHLQSGVFFSGGGKKTVCCVCCHVFPME